MYEFKGSRTQIETRADLDITCGFWQVWITDRDPTKYRLAWEGVKRAEALYVAADLEMTGSYYGVEVVKKTRRMLPCTTR